MNEQRFTFRAECMPSHEHVTVRVFANGASCGLVTMRIAEADAFKRRVNEFPALLAAARAVLTHFAGQEPRYLDGKATEVEWLSALRTAIARAEGDA